MSIKITNGSGVKIAMLHQFTPYAGLMAGLPNDKMNNAIVKSAVEQASTYLFRSKNDIKVTLVEPIITKNEVNLGEGKNISYSCLPRCATVIFLDDRDRHAIVVLFNNNLADHNEIEQALKDLDWKEISEEYSW